MSPHPLIFSWELFWQKLAIDQEINIPLSGRQREALIFALFAGYIGIIFGHKSNNLKSGKSVLYGFIAYMVPQIITIGIIFILGLFNDTFGVSINSYEELEEVYVYLAHISVFRETQLEDIFLQNCSCPHLICTSSQQIAPLDFSVALLHDCSYSYTIALKITR